MKYVMMAFALFLIGCMFKNTDAYNINILPPMNTPDGKQMNQDGRDAVSSRIAKMPEPPSESAEPPKPIDVKVDNPNEPMDIDHGLDFSKIK
jgi:hypothetical protein